MKRLAIFISLLGGVVVAVPAIAQTTPDIAPSTESTSTPDLPPTENAGSADLMTRPVSTNSSTPSDVNALPVSGIIQELRIIKPEVILIEGTDARSNGPANADHVQFVFN
jgi:hypothetical protein